MSSEIFEKLLDTAGNFRTAVDLLLLGNSLGLFREEKYNDILTSWLDRCKQNLNIITNLLLCTPKGFDFIKSNPSLYRFFNEECKFFDLSSIGRICASSIEDYLHIIEVLYGKEWFLICQFKTLTHQEYAEGIHQYIDSRNGESDISIFNKKFLLLHMFATSVDFNKNHQIVRDFLDEVSSIQFIRGQESLINFIFECFKSGTLNIDNIVWLVIKNPNTMKTILKKLEEIEFFHTEIYRLKIDFYINLLYFLLYIE